MSHDLSKTIAESFKLFQSELEIQYEDIAGVEQEETPQTVTTRSTGSPLRRRRKILKLQTSRKL